MTRRPSRPPGAACRPPAKTFFIQPRTISPNDSYMRVESCSSESDSGFGGEAGYPIPSEAATQPNYVEGGVSGGGSSGDRHLLVVDRDRWLLFELFAARWNSSAQRWEAGSGAVFNLASNARRPEGWTSADAAGLAILPGLARPSSTSDRATGPTSLLGCSTPTRTVRSTWSGYIHSSACRCGRWESGPNATRPRASRTGGRTRHRLPTLMPSHPRRRSNGRRHGPVGGMRRPAPFTHRSSP